MKVLSRVIKNWLPEQSRVQSDLDNWFTGCTVSKIELLVEHIEAFRVRLDEVSSMEQDLVLLLEAQLSIIRKKKLEVT